MTSPAPARLKRSVGGQLAALALALIVPTLAFFALVLWQSASAERARVEKDARAAAGALAIAMDREIVAIQGMLETLATAPSLARGDVAAFQEQARLLHGRTGLHFSLRDATGTLVGTTRRDAPPAAPVLREADREAMRTARPAVSDAYARPANGEAAVQVVVPVRTGDRVTHVLGAGFGLDRVAGVLAREGIPETWIGTVVDRAGIVLGRTRDASAHAGKPVSAGFRARTAEAGGIHEGQDEAGAPLLVAHQRSAMTGWTAAVGVPRAELQAPLRASLTNLALLGLALAGVAFALAFLLGRRITGAMRALRAAAAAIERGEIAAPARTALGEADDIGRALVTASAALKEREAQLQRVLESTGDGVFAVDHGWRFTFLNERAKAQLAKGREFVGRRLWDAFPEAVDSGFWRAYQEAVSTGQPTRADEYYAPLDTWFEATAYPSAEGLTVFFRDVTEKRRAAGTVRDSEERLRLALSGSKAGFWQVTLDPHSVYGDASWRELYGFSPDEEGLAEKWRARVHPDDLPGIEAAIRDHLAGTADGWTQDFRVLHPTKGLRWIHDRVRVRRDARGRPIFFGGLNFDITHRKEMENALRASEARLRLAQAAGRIVSWEWDIAAGEVAWSGPIDLLGIAEGLPGPSQEAFLAAIDPRDRAATVERLQAAAEGQPYAAEFRHVGADGRTRWLASRGEGVRDEAGTLQRMVGCTYDITAQKEAEEALAQLNADLERRVEEGAAKLIHLQKMESVGRLTGGIAHDFNNLLAVVMANLEVLQARLPAGETRFIQLVDNAMRGAERGVALTQRLLAFARRQELKPEAVDVATLVRDMADLLARSLGTAIQVETRLAPGLPPALVDATQLELAVLNLAVNARDAMPEGGRLAIEVDEAPGGRVRIRVTDTGTGMDEDILRQATEPFFTTKDVGKGTGLGLSMVHGLAAQSGGGFSLRSRPGEGTTAEIVLPRAEGVALAPAAPMPTYHLAAGRRGLSVLVVDDDPLVLSGTVRMLEALGHRVSEAASAFDALALLREGPAIDVVLTDEVMPGLRGLQLAGLIAREWPGLPVVLVTGYADLPPGADRLVAARLDKPFRVPTLAAALAKACDGAGAPRPAVAAAR